ncbi:FkbM family methyltransferase [Cognatilysobacter lacus]|uniref:FkbM family methyltransferase n=1 Tax=Cognatilysobacter lacus TaxID=1643323 RepID=A0A5D8YY20_9GAMM|nr:FkbM family methyltransferase [Lysobacter lacus]TZF87297.1 FkbM family methyltransferase [Lysobacter lacus]
MSALTVLRFVVTHRANTGHRLQALWRLVRWQIASRLVNGDIVYAWVNGSKFLVRSGENGLTGNIYVGLQEFDDMAFVLHMLRPGDLFVDVGANVGSYSILACAVAGAHGCAVEPVPATFERLVENMRINHLDEAVQCVNAGLGSEPGTLRFSSDMGVCNRALASSDTRPGVVEVQGITLDALLAGRSPRLIKIDVEGYESAVLAGADATLRDPYLQAVIMELNGSGAQFGFDESKLFGLMVSHGFQPCAYVPAERRLVDAHGPGATASDNTIFVRDIDAVRNRLREAEAFDVNGKRF